MDSEDFHVDVEKSPENLENERSQASTLSLPPQLPPSTSKPITPPTSTTSVIVSLSAPVVTSGQKAQSPGISQQEVLATPSTADIAVTSTSVETSSEQQKAASTITVLTPTKQHQKVFHTGTKRPVVVLKDFGKKFWCCFCLYIWWGR